METTADTGEKKPQTKDIVSFLCKLTHPFTTRLHTHTHTPTHTHTYMTILMYLAYWQHGNGSSWEKSLPGCGVSSHLHTITQQHCTVTCTASWLHAALTSCMCRVATTDVWLYLHPTSSNPHSCLTRELGPSQPTCAEGSAASSSACMENIPSENMQSISDKKKEIVTKQTLYQT